ncbi:MAG: STAS/SEC14 domain-containing protein [Anaerolineae bacterium]|nr:STAS/SEC14 domain-containing protein [Anaerolineae bacterium]
MAYTLHTGDDGILQVSISGEFTEEELQSYMKDLETVLADIPDGEKLKTFIDTTDLGRVNPNLRRSVGDFMENPKLGKTAVLGNSRIVKVMIDFALKASGTHHMKYYTSRDEATAWLHTD